MRKLLVAVTLLLQVACTGIPEGMTPVDDFDLDRYLGTWYEIARLDHSFERGLSRVTAEYTLRDDGGVNVINRGFSDQKQAWKTAEGKAYFVDGESTGHLKVSFFGPFYGSYVIFELDKHDYQYAFISSYNKEYLWLLARTPTVSDAVTDAFIRLSGSQGFNTDALIFVEQGPVDSATTD